MMRIETLINAYIDANIILILAFAVWWAARALLRRTGSRHDYLLQLRLTEGFMLVALLSPVLALGVAWVNGTLFPDQSMNAADFVIAQYLDGRVNMPAERFETLLGLRQDFVADLAALATPLAQAVAALFLTGFVISLGRMLHSMAVLRGVIRGSFLWRRFGRLDLRLSDAITVPFSTRGLLRRHIVIPSGMLADRHALRIALAHEMQHMRRPDTEWELLLVLLQPLFFWNPGFTRWKSGLEHLRELGCDQVLLRRNRVGAREYADCLLAVCRRSLADRGTFNMVTPKVPFLTRAKGRRNLKALRQRITAISGQRRGLARPGLLMWPTLLAAAFVITLGANSIRKPADWSQDRLMLSTIVNLERLQTRNSGLAIPIY